MKYDKLRFCLANWGLTEALLPDDNFFDMLFVPPNQDQIAQVERICENYTLGHKILNDTLSKFVLNSVNLTEKSKKTEFLTSCMLSNEKMIDIAKNKLKLDPFILKKTNENSQYATIIKVLIGGLHEKLALTQHAHLVEQFIENIWSSYLTEELKKIEKKEEKMKLTATATHQSSDNSNLKKSTPVGSNRMNWESVKKSFVGQKDTAKSVKMLLFLLKSSNKEVSLSEFESLLTEIDKPALNTTLDTLLEFIRDGTAEHFKKLPPQIAYKKLQLDKLNCLLTYLDKQEPELSHMADLCTQHFKSISDYYRLLDKQKQFAKSNSSIIVDQRRLLLFLEQPEKQLPIEKFNTLIKAISIDRLQKLWDTPLQLTRENKRVVLSEKVSQANFVSDKLACLQSRLANELFVLSNASQQSIEASLSSAPSSKLTTLPPVKYSLQEASKDLPSSTSTTQKQMTISNDNAALISLTDDFNLSEREQRLIIGEGTLNLNQHRLLACLLKTEQALPLQQFEMVLSQITKNRLHGLWHIPMKTSQQQPEQMHKKERNPEKVACLERKLKLEPTQPQYASNVFPGSLSNQISSSQVNIHFSPRQAVQPVYPDKTVLWDVSGLALQDKLTDACDRADLDMVKTLLEYQGASATANDSNGENPTIAAIRGMAFNVLIYLESNTNYTQADWLGMMKDYQRSHRNLILFNRSTANFEAILNHYNSNKESFTYNYRALEKRRLLVIEHKLATREFLTFFKEPLSMSKTITKVIHRPPAIKKQSALLEFHTPIDSLVIPYEWKIHKLLRKTTFGKPKASIYLLWQLSDIMSAYLRNKGVRLSESYPPNSNPSRKLPTNLLNIQQVTEMQSSSKNKLLTTLPSNQNLSPTNSLTQSETSQVTEQFFSSSKTTLPVKTDLPKEEKKPIEHQISTPPAQEKVIKNSDPELSIEKSDFSRIQKRLIAGQGTLESNQSRFLAIASKTDNKVPLKQFEAMIDQIDEDRLYKLWHTPLAGSNLSPAQMKKSKIKPEKAACIERRLNPESSEYQCDLNTVSNKSPTATETFLLKPISSDIESALASKTTDKKKGATIIKSELSSTTAQSPITPTTTSSSKDAPSKKTIFLPKQQRFIAGEGSLVSRQNQLLTFLEMEEQQLSLKQFEAMLNKIDSNKLHALWHKKLKNSRLSPAQIKQKNRKPEKFACLKRRLDLVTADEYQKPPVFSASPQRTSAPVTPSLNLPAESGTSKEETSPKYQRFSSTIQPPVQNSATSSNKKLPTKKITFSDKQKRFIAGESSFISNQEQLLFFIKRNEQELPIEQFKAILNEVNQDRLHKLWHTPLAGSKLSPAQRNYKKIHPEKVSCLERKLNETQTNYQTKSSVTSNVSVSLSMPEKKEAILLSQSKETASTNLSSQQSNSNSQTPEIKEKLVIKSEVSTVTTKKTNTKLSTPPLNVKPLLTSNPELCDSEKQTDTTLPQLSGKPSSSDTAQLLSNFSFSKSQQKFIASNSVIDADQSRLDAFLTDSEKALSSKKFSNMISQIDKNRLELIWNTPRSSGKRGKPLSHEECKRHYNQTKLHILENRIKEHKAESQSCTTNAKKSIINSSRLSKKAKTVQKNEALEKPYFSFSKSEIKFIASNAAISTDQTHLHGFLSSPGSSLSPQKFSAIIEQISIDRLSLLWDTACPLGTKGKPLSHLSVRKKFDPTKLAILEARLKENSAVSDSAQDISHDASFRLFGNQSVNSEPDFTHSTPAPDQSC